MILYSNELNFFDQEVEILFDKLVNDYNSRLNGKYYQKDYDIANKQVENLRKQIEKNAISNIEYLNSL